MRHEAARLERGTCAGLVIRCTNARRRRREGTRSRFSVGGSVRRADETRGRDRLRCSLPALHLWGRSARPCEGAGIWSSRTARDRHPLASPGLSRSVAMAKPLRRAHDRDHSAGSPRPRDRPRRGTSSSSAAPLPPLLPRGANSPFAGEGRARTMAGGATRPRSARGTGDQARRPGPERPGARAGPIDPLGLPGLASRQHQAQPRPEGGEHEGGERPRLGRDNARGGLR